MRLLNTSTGHLESFTLPLPQDISYAALSHVWAREDDPHGVLEQTFDEVHLIQSIHGSTSSRSILPALSVKIQRACEVARSRYKYIWVDTCCINKTSSAEVSEAINSMYSLYASSGTCFAYLADVHDDDDPHLPNSKFRRSEWFKRAWTLQELIAPREVVFLSATWRRIGTKHDLAQVVQEITRISKRVLLNTRELSDVSVAKRMSWAARRRATRVEDMAYCLLGIFGVHLRLNYGEGQNAFIRLQEAILKQIPDQTLFTWGPPPIPYSSNTDHSTKMSRAFSRNEYSCLFAPSPSSFEGSSNFAVVSHVTFVKTLGESHRDGVRIPHPEFTPTAYGVRAGLPIIQYGEYQLALLACARGSESLALVLRPPQSQNTGMDVAVGMLSCDPETQRQQYSRLVSIPHKQISRLLVEVQEVYIRPNIHTKLDQSLYGAVETLPGMVHRSSHTLISAEEISHVGSTSFPGNPRDPYDYSHLAPRIGNDSRTNITLGSSTTGARQSSEVHRPRSQMTSTPKHEPLSTPSTPVAPPEGTPLPPASHALPRPSNGKSYTRLLLAAPRAVFRWVRHACTLRRSSRPPAQREDGDTTSDNNAPDDRRTRSIRRLVSSRLARQPGEK